MRILFITLVYLSCSINLLAQFTDSLEFSLLRQDDNLDYLDDSENKSNYEKIKYISIGKESYLSFGGSIRNQFESFINEQFQNAQEQDNFWYLNRNMIHIHLNIKDRIELFSELNNSNILSKEDLSPVDKDQLSFNQFFVRLKLHKKLSINAGRENLKIGSRRLFDPREGPNVRRSFDQIKLYYESKTFNANLFFATLVDPRPGVFDNDYLNFNEYITGLYISKSIKEHHNLDIYTLFHYEDDVTYNSGTSNERRASIGARHYGHYKTLSFDNEAIFQFGEFGNQNIAAWTISFKLENEFQLTKQAFNLGIKTELISGDSDPNDDKQNTFNALYPRGAYFGRVARFGPSNLIDIHPYFNITIDKLFIELDYDAFWRFSEEDGIYNPALILEYPDLNNRRFIAHQIGTLFAYELFSNLALEFETNFILPGDFLKESNLCDNVYHFVFTTDFKF